LRRGSVCAGLKRLGCANREGKPKSGGCWVSGGDWGLPVALCIGFARRPPSTQPTGLGSQRHGLNAPGRSISRILCHLAMAAIISLGSLPGTYEASNLLSLFGLAPDGGCLAAALLRSPVVSYTAVSPLRLQETRFVSVARSRTFRRAGISPASCSMEYGLSSTSASEAAITRPTWGTLILPHYSVGPGHPARRAMSHQKACALSLHCKP